MDEPQSILVDAGSPPAQAPASAAVDELLAKKSRSNSSSAESNKDNNSDETDNNSEGAASDVTDGAIAAANDQGDMGFSELDVAPGHLHALSRIPDARLRGLLPRHNSDGKLAGAGGRSVDGAGSRRSRSTGRSRAHGNSGRRSVNSSRSSSPLPLNNPSSSNNSNSNNQENNPESSSSIAGSHVRPAGDASTAYSTARSNQSVHSLSAPLSHCSSLDGIFDPDVLLDRLGFIDLDPPLPHEIRCGPLAAPGTIDGKSNNSGGLTPVNERLSEETLEDCHAFTDLVMIDNLRQHMTASHGGGGMSSTMSMPSVAHSSLSGMRSDMSVGSLSVGSFKGGHSRGGSVAGGSLMGDGENSVLLGTLDEEGEDAIEDDSVGSSSGVEKLGVMEPVQEITRAVAVEVGNSD